MSHDCTFTGHALDRADQHRADPNWLNQRLGDASTRFLPFARLRPALRTDSGLTPAWVRRSDVGSALGGDSNVVLLGIDEDGSARFAVAVDEDQAIAGAKFTDVRSAATQMAASGGAVPEVAAIGLGRCLLDWNARHRFCAQCGHPSKTAKGGFGRHCTNPQCGADHFARVDPVVIMLAVDDDRCALGRQPRFPPRMYSALAGFVEPGESIEEAVRREVAEEASLQVGNVRYFASQPWPFPSSLMIGCVARAKTFDIEPDHEELEDVRWFQRAELAAFLEGAKSEFLLPPPMTIAHQLIRAWVEGSLKR